MEVKDRESKAARKEWQYGERGRRRKGERIERMTYGKDRMLEVGKVRGKGQTKERRKEE